MCYLLLYYIYYDCTCPLNKFIEAFLFVEKFFKHPVCLTLFLIEIITLRAC
jgi:hypothetical protein